MKCDICKEEFDSDEQFEIKITQQNDSVDYLKICEECYIVKLKNLRH